MTEAWNTGIAPDDGELGPGPRGPPCNPSQLDQRSLWPILRHFKTWPDATANHMAQRLGKNATTFKKRYVPCLVNDRHPDEGLLRTTRHPVRYGATGVGRPGDVGYRLTAKGEEYLRKLDALFGPPG